MKKLFSPIPYLQGERLILKALTAQDAAALSELTGSAAVYQYLPAFLFEKRYKDPLHVIRRLYSEALADSLILGIYMEGQLCGLTELYGYRDKIHKISVGYRLAERWWGRGIATEALAMMVDFLYRKTDIAIITASTMTENLASANVLRKNSFKIAAPHVQEDWGFAHPTVVDKWIRTSF